MERSYINQMVDAKKLGLMFHGDILGTKYYLNLSTRLNHG